MQRCHLPIGQHPQAHLLGRQNYLNLISLQPFNATLVGNRSISFNASVINSKNRLLEVKCSASSADTATRNAEWPPLQGSFTYKQLRALPVSIKSMVFVD
jgi:hypothetical protein